jgi:hypothetical protein
MIDPGDLKCGHYEGRCFGAPDDDEAVCVVGGERIFEVNYFVVSDNLLESQEVLVDGS